MRMKGSQGRPLDDPGWRVLRPLFAQACAHVFASYGLGLRESDGPSTADHSIAAIIGFAGAEMRGSMTLMTTPELLLRAPPYPGADDMNEHQWLGWLGELSNQTLGLLKHRLLDYRVTLEMGIPELIQGGGLRSSLDRRAVRLDAEGGGCLHLYVYALLCPEVTITYQPLPKEERPIEDDLVFL